LVLSLAERIDDEHNSATSASMNATALLRAMEALRAMVPAEVKSDRVDEISRARARRISGRSAS
jgi:hypothetical protein